MRALIIDDSRTIRIMLGQIMRESGFDVTDAGNGREALERLDQHGCVDLALVDWNMPKMNGYDFIRAVRANRAYDNMRVMMVTAQTDVEQIVQALKIGADEYVMKPFTKEVILEKLSLMEMR